jgi:pSer/pThr/pTyr-binding forkhead associated (FHA) protein
MPKLILKSDQRVLQECAVGTHPVTIGRLPDNMLVIDNPAVSGRHARVYREGSHYVLEDLKSTNGTFVNDKPIARHTLLEGDVVLVGKHTVVFTQAGAEPEPAAVDQFAPAIETLKQKPLLSGLDQGRPSQVYDAVVPKTAIPTAQGRIGTVRVIAGTSSQQEFVLAAVTTMIGKADNAQI